MGLHQPWEKGVELELRGLGKYRTAKSTEDAGYSLINRWPSDDGPAFERAKAACLSALEDIQNGIKISQARKAPIDAADEADIFVRDK